MDVRLAAADALWRIEKKPAAVSALIEMLKDDKEKHRPKIAAALGKIGADSALPALAEALKDNDVEVRVGAAEALPWRIKKDPAAILALIEIIKTRSAVLALVHGP